MAIQVRDAGSWKTPTPYVRQDGRWVIPYEIYARDAGSWKLAFRRSGVLWRLASTNIPSDYDYALITAGNGAIVMSAQSAFPNKGLVSTSTDLASLSFSSIDFGTSYPVARLHFHNGRFFGTAAGNAFVTSTNGTSWSSVTLPVTGSVSSIAYGNSRYVAVLSSSNVVISSTNGTSWSQVGTLPWDSATVSNPKIAYGNGVFVVVISSSGTGPIPASKIAYSTNNGATWTVVPVSDDYNSNPAYRYHYKVEFGNGVFVVASRINVGTNVGTGLAYSPDGITWTGVSAANTPFGTNVEFIDVAFGDGVFVATQATHNSPKFIISNDGVKWRAAALNSGVPENIVGWSALTYDQSRRAFLCAYWQSRPTKIVYSKFE
jgi:hypothetical protein